MKHLLLTTALAGFVVPSLAQACLPFNTLAADAFIVKNALLSKEFQREVNALGVGNSSSLRAITKNELEIQVQLTGGCTVNLRAKPRKSAENDEACLSLDFSAETFCN